MIPLTWSASNPNMIPYERTRQQTIPNSAVKIIGVGGAGANMLDRIALDGMEGAELLACNTDVRTLTSSVAPEKIQLGRNLTKGLGSGGDPALGHQAAQEAELEIRDALRDRKIIFICVGLGGGTGSGAAPLVARLAREQGAFTVVFATTPFNFEGARRREQAEVALDELSSLANALITFDNTRMGELVLAKQGVHEAFSAADRMVSESIRAVTRIVMRPGLVNIGLDDLMAALSSPKSRCLFGSGIAHGENRAQQALKNALVSPLLDRGSLLHDTDTVLVHVCGGEDMTLYELELLMRGLSKHVPETAQILFGTSVDPAMAEALSVTLVSSLPEERLLGESSERHTETHVPESGDDGAEDANPDSAVVGLDEGGGASGFVSAGNEEQALPPESGSAEDSLTELDALPEAELDMLPDMSADTMVPDSLPEGTPESPRSERKPRVEIRSTDPGDDEQVDGLPLVSEAGSNVRMRVKLPSSSDTSVEGDVFSASEEMGLEDDAEDISRPVSIEAVPSLADTGQSLDLGGEEESAPSGESEPAPGPAPINSESLEEIQASAQSKRPQDELALDGGPKGRFQGEEPNLIEGEDLDIPPFLRKKK
jgi:cell division protein FtsZ